MDMFGGRQGKRARYERIISILLLHAKAPVKNASV